MEPSAHLFAPLTIRGVRFRNRIAVAPMSQYSSEDGFAGDWHLVHLGSRAVGGAAAVIGEAAAVEPRGRISPNDLGIWKDEHIGGLARIARFVKTAGRGSRHPTGARRAQGEHRAALERRQRHSSRGRRLANGRPQRDSVPALGSGPAELNTAEIPGIVEAFARAARWAREAGFELLEIHAAHGYLLHQFLSPLSNRRRDGYGGSFDGRTRIVCQVASAVRAAWPETFPLFVRISATDWVDGGWNLDDSVQLSRRLRECGVDLVDCSSGGTSPTLASRPPPATRSPSPSASAANAAF